MLKNTDVKEMKDAIDGLEATHRIDEIEDKKVLRQLIRNSWEMNRLAIKMLSSYHKVLNEMLIRAEVERAISNGFKKGK